MTPATVRSPCVNVCRMDEASGLCVGCRRTLDEIAAWSVMDDRARLAVLGDLALRTVPGSAGAESRSESWRDGGPAAGREGTA